MLDQVEDPNFLIPIKSSGYLMASSTVGLTWGFLALLDVGAALLQYFPHPGLTWFNIHEYCSSLNYFFTITAFALAVHILDKDGRKHFSLKHTSMVLSIFIVVVFQVWMVFNTPPPSDPKREDE